MDHRLPYGCHDMAGNVWEWCADWYDSSYYPSAPFRNPPGPDAGSNRVYRGGSYDNRAAWVRSADRFGGIPAGALESLGFRAAAPAP